MAALLPYGCGVLLAGAAPGLHRGPGTAALNGSQGVLSGPFVHGLLQAPGELPAALPVSSSRHSRCGLR